jgi:predicted kinase
MSENSKVLHIAFGVPGTGKSTLFKTLASNKGSKAVFEANQFEGLYVVKEENITNENGLTERKKYLNFQPKLLSNAHKWCQEQVEDSMKNGISDIFQSNTNLNPCDMIVYLKLAYKYNYKVKIHIPEEGQFLQYETNLNEEGQIKKFKSHRSKKYFNTNINDKNMEKVIPNIFLNRMISDYKKNGKILRKIESHLIETNNIYSPKEWFKEIIKACFWCKPLMKNLAKEILGANKR